MTTNPASLPHKTLNPKERIFVDSRLAGLSMTASASAAGWANPGKKGTDVNKRPHIQAALMKAMDETSKEVGFSRREAHEMLMQAYMNAATAAEQIQAVKEMISLHGIAEAKKIEVKHAHTGTVSLERMETQELLKLADMEDLAMEGEFEVIDDTARLPRR